MTNNFFDFPSYIAHFKDKPFIISEKYSYTYQDFCDAVCQTMTVLKSNKVISGDCVALIDDAGFNYVVNLFALFQIGAIGVLINPGLSVNHIANQLNKIRCKKYIGELNLPGDFVNCINPMAVKSVIAINKTLRPVALHQDATVLFTSGSGGKSKVCLHSLANHYYSALGSNDNIKINENDRWLQVLPIFHVAGLAIIFRTFIAGASMVIPQNRYDLAINIERFDITHVSFVPTQLYRFMNENISPEKYRNLKVVLIGGDKVHARLIEKALHKSLPIYTSYGSTEMSSQITTTSPGKLFEESLNSGRPLKYRDLKIDQDGEILVQGETLFKGYLSEDRLDPAVDHDGWFRTGDLGRIDKSGNLIIKGRKDNMFISRGENIYPEEVEQELIALDYVEEALVVGINDKEYGTLPAAFIKTEKERMPLDNKLSSALLLKLPKYKVPMRYFPWPHKIDPGLKPDRTKFKKIAQKLSSGH